MSAEKPNTTSTFTSDEDDLDSITLEEAKEYKNDILSPALTGSKPDVNQEYRDIIRKNLDFALEHENMHTLTAVRVTEVCTLDSQEGGISMHQTLATTNDRISAIEKIRADKSSGSSLPSAHMIELQNSRVISLPPAPSISTDQFEELEDSPPLERERPVSIASVFPSSVSNDRVSAINKIRADASSYNPGFSYAGGSTNIPKPEVGKKDEDLHEADDDIYDGTPPPPPSPTS